MCSSAVWPDVCVLSAGSDVAEVGIEPWSAACEVSLCG